jgi:hypothetical protein
MPIPGVQRPAGALAARAGIYQAGEQSQTAKNSPKMPRRPKKQFSGPGKLFRLKVFTSVQNLQKSQ